MIFRALFRPLCQASRYHRTFESLAASVPPSSHRRFSSAASRNKKGTGDRQLPTVERGVGNRQLPKLPPVERGVTKRQLSSPPPVGRGTPKKSELPALDSIAAMVDGDSASVRSTVDFLAGLEQHGRVVERRLFAEPRRVESRTWKSALHSNSIDFIPVPRGIEPSRDPNDDAIYGQVRELLQSPRIGAIALLVNDKDYVPLVTEIVSAGRQCFVKFPRMGPGQAGPFERAGAQILAQDTTRASPNYACVLHSDGSGSVIALSDASSLELEQDEVNMIASQLRALGYRSGPRDPLVPSIAKFWFSNDLGDITVFPGNYAAISLRRMFRERQHAKWIPGRQDLAFVLPFCPTILTPVVRDEYGTKACASYARAGIGPFVLIDSSTIAQEMLRKTGFIDDGHNACPHEGLEVFASLAENAHAMRKTGTQFSDFDTPVEKAEKIRRLLLSDSCYGTFRVPPRDRGVREHLFAKGLLNNEHAPSDEVFCAMGSLVSSAGLLPKKTYHYRLLQCANVFGNRESHPLRRQ